MDKATTTFGLRHDPFKWVNEAETLEAALARRMLGVEPHERDEELIKDEVSRALSAIGEAGRWDGAALLRLSELGVTAENETVRATHAKLTQSALASMDRNILDWGAIYHLGDKKNAEVNKFLSTYGVEQKSWDNPYRGCPWTLELHWYSLWHCREIPGMEQAIRESMRRMAADIDEFGHAYPTPGGFLHAAGYVDAPEARELVTKMLPWIARTQQSTGDWQMKEGTHGISCGTTIDVLRALKTHGLLDALRSAPPPPLDWTIVRTVPVPGESPCFLVRDGDDFWTLCETSGTAYKFSVEDGEVQSAIKLPGPADQYLGLRCFGLWGDRFATAVWDEATVTKYDKTTGAQLSRFKVDGMWSIGSGVAHEDSLFVVSHDGHLFRMEKDTPSSEKIEVGTITGGAAKLARTPNGFWYYGMFTHCLHRINMEGECLEWGENPIETEIKGLSVVDDVLCVLDSEKKRVCFIRRGEPR